MKKTILLLTGLAFGTHFASLSQPSDLPVRQAISDSMFSSAGHVLALTKCKLAEATMYYIRSHSEIAFPSGDWPDSAEIEFLQPAKDIEERIGIIPLLQEDTEDNGGWARCVRSFGSIFYLPQANGVCFFEKNDLSRVWQGFNFLSECYRAVLESRAKSGIATREQSEVLLEYYVQAFNGELLDSLGGKEYHDALKNCVADMRQYIEDTAKDPDDPFPGLDFINDANKTFGRYLSPGDKQIRRCSIWVEANFRLINDMFERREAFRRKLGFLAELYREMAVVQPEAK